MARRFPGALVRAALVAGALVLASPAHDAEARSLPPNFQDQIVVGNLFEPCGMAFLPDGRLLVIERGGRVRMIVDGKLGVVDPLVEPDSVEASSPESGLLGIAIDPRWPLFPYVYLHHTKIGGGQRVVRYEASGDLDDGSSVILAIEASSRYVVLDDLPNVDPTRNGGGLQFAPDGRLFVGLGDDADECAAQDTAALKGVLLRLETSTLPPGNGGPPDRAWLVPSDNPFVAHATPDARLAWALGLRDPYRFRFDPRDGGLFVGDAGGAGPQEIERITVAGGDFGWPLEQGSVPREHACESIDPGALTASAWSYTDVDGGGLGRVVAGGVYTATGCPTCDFPGEYLGDYFYADARVGFIRRLREVGGTWSPAPDVMGQPAPGDWGSGYASIADLAPAPDGGLWYCHQGTGAADGEVRRIVYVPPTGSVTPRASAGIELSAPAPSPMRSRVSFSYRLDQAAAVEVDVVDASGRRVRRLVDATILPAGRHTLTWDGRTESGSEARAGLYLVVLRSAGVVQSRRIPLLR